MNAIEHLGQSVTDRFPSAKLAFDPPGRPDGPWFLDILLGDHSLVIEWRPERGFGITSKREPAYGEGPDEVYADLAEAEGRVRILLLIGGATRPPAATSAPRPPDDSTTDLERLLDALRSTRAPSMLSVTRPAPARDKKRRPARRTDRRTPPLTYSDLVAAIERAIRKPPVGSR